MDCLEFIFCLLLLISCKKNVVEPLDVYKIQEDIAKFNKTCNEESCKCHDVESLSSRSCHCGIQCVQLGTCCIDSSYVNMLQPELKPACRSVYNSDNYFIVDRCPSEDNWSSSCHEEYNVHQHDVHQLVPLTSLWTYITYKNYYCLRCYEATDRFINWNVKVEFSNKTSVDESEVYGRLSLAYSPAMDAWKAIYAQSNDYIWVNVSIQVPDEIKNLAHICEPDVISDCSEEWSDEEVKSKCQSYMDIKKVVKNHTLTLKYKNIHCALCNFESLDDIKCKKGGISAFGAENPFSFTHLLDINSSDGELDDKIQKCSDDHVWDPYTKKCRKLICALPGFKAQNGKCVQK